MRVLRRVVLVLLVASFASCATPGPLWQAARRGDLEAVRGLLDAGARVDLWDNGTPLMVAAENGDLPLARFLLERGADPNATQREDWTALGFAAENARQDVALLLLEHGADLDRAAAGLEKRAASLASSFPAAAGKCQAGIRLLSRLAAQRHPPSSGPVPAATPETRGL